MKKGEIREIVIPLQAIVVQVEIDPDEGFRGTVADLEEQVTNAVVEDIDNGVNTLCTDGHGWAVTDFTVKQGSA